MTFNVKVKFILCIILILTVLKEFKGLTALMYAAKNSASGILSKNETYPKPLIFVE